MPDVLCSRLPCLSMQTDPYAPASTDLLLRDKYILVQRGKKNYTLLRAV